MYFVPLILILSCNCASIASSNNGSSDGKVDLDIYARNTTDKVKVDIKEDGNMIIYKIEPKNGYKIGRFVDGDKVIYELTQQDTYKHLDVKCLKSTDEPMLVSLCYSQGICRSELHYYFQHPDGWSVIDKGFADFLVEKMKACKLIKKDTIFHEYNQHIGELDKQRVEVDLTKEEVPSGITRKDCKEGDTDSCLYTVDEKTVISKVVNGSVDVWERGDDLYGCYKMKVYHLPQGDKLLILAVKGPAGMRLTFCGKTSDGNYGKIKKEEFDNKAKDIQTNPINVDFKECVYSSY